MAEFKEEEHPRKKDGKFAPKGKGERSILKSIKSYKKQIAKHQQKILTPEKFVSNWDKKSKVEKTGLIKYWEKEIKNFNNQIKKLED